MLFQCVYWVTCLWKNLFCRLHDNSGGDIYLAFNAHDYFIKVPIPAPPVKRNWFRVVGFFSHLQYIFVLLASCYFTSKLHRLSLPFYVIIVIFLCFVCDHAIAHTTPFWTTVFSSSLMQTIMLSYIVISLIDICIHIFY